MDTLFKSLAAMLGIQYIMIMAYLYSLEEFDVSIRE